MSSIFLDFSLLTQHILLCVINDIFLYYFWYFNYTYYCFLTMPLLRDFVAAPPKGLSVYIHIPPTPYSGLLLSNKMQAFCWVWGLRTSKLFGGNINESRYSICLHAFSKVRVCTFVCTRFTSVRLSRQKFAVIRINFAICKFFPHNDK